MVTVLINNESGWTEDVEEYSGDKCDNDGEEYTVPFSGTIK